MSLGSQAMAKNTTPMNSSTPRTDTPSTSYVSPISTNPVAGSYQSPTVPAMPFMPDFGLSALSSLTQIAKIQATQPKDYASAASLHPSAFQQPSTVAALTADFTTQTHLAAQLAQSSTLAQSLTNQNLASLGSLSLEAFKQVSTLVAEFLLTFARSVAR